jgi:hypothetical protein
VLGVGQQRIAETVLVVELLLRGRFVRADADDRGVADLSGDVSQVARLLGATGRRGLRIEENQHPPTAVRGQVDGVTVLVCQADLRGSGTKSEHVVRLHAHFRHGSWQVRCHERKFFKTLASGTTPGDMVTLRGFLECSERLTSGSLQEGHANRHQPVKGGAK